MTIPLWKRVALTAYYYASRPLRAWNYWTAASRDHLPLMVLYYHRIADDRATPWTISNAMFIRQIEWLRERFDIISLHDSQARICRGYNPQPCISITFDDGYADNCQRAVPWLIKHRVPCTYFVTLQNVLREEPFSHDLVAGCRLLPNTVEQLLAMAAAGVDIGAHTYTHADLGAITDPRLLYHEIVQSKARPGGRPGPPCPLFCLSLRSVCKSQPCRVLVGQAGRLCGCVLGLRRLQFPR